jgi:hypothetical protein
VDQAVQEVGHRALFRRVRQMESHVPRGERKHQRLGLQREELHLLQPGHRSHPGCGGHTNAGRNEGELPCLMSYSPYCSAFGTLF